MALHQLCRLHVVDEEKKPDPERLAKSCPLLDGPDDKLLNWIIDSGLVAICTCKFVIAANSARAPTSDIYPALPLHDPCRFKQGIHLVEPWYFTGPAAYLLEARRPAFFLPPPLRLPGFVGSPPTSIAAV